MPEESGDTGGKTWKRTLAPVTRQAPEWGWDGGASHPLNPQRKEMTA